MRCQSCSAENPDGAKFCIQCAAPFLRTCPKCGVENPANARFCAQCATRLGPSPASLPERTTGAKRDAGERAATIAEPTVLEGERKTVTALFADIKGSTELEQDLDPEEARAIVDPALKLMIDAVRRYDGYIVQSTGDGVFALFGAPVAHEDHPQRALYAALRMQDDIRRYADKLRAEGRSPLQIRVGADTGEVVLRTIETGGKTEYTPIGHVANLASRMQSLASPGSTVISESTRKLVEGYFALRPLGPARLKGISEAVNVHEVTGLGPLRTRLQRAAGRGLTEFVGRAREMAALAHAAEQAKAGHGQIVAAVAMAGVGKSRLFYEFKVKNQQDWMFLEAFSISHGKASAFMPVIDLLQSYFGIEPGDDPRKRREKVAGRLAILDPALEDARPYLFALLGIAGGDEHPRGHWEQSLDRLEEYLHKLQQKDPLAQMDARVRQRRTLDAIKRILLRESLNQPLVLMFEDLHWIDEETQALLNLLADSIATARILLLVNYRPEYAHQWGSKTYYTQLRLDPLGRESADAMLTALLGDGGELQALKRLIIDKTEGNPFFIEEIVQALHEEGALVRNGAVHLVRPLETLKIPATVQAILASRIDRLPAAQKDLLQTVAVIGKDFPLGLTARVAAKSAEELERMLAELQLAEFIYEQPAVGEVKYTFKHALTQEVAYNSILNERRKSLHERIGGALEALYAGALDERLGDLAHHYGRSGNVPKAIDYLGAAGNQAAQKSLYSETLGYVERGLGLLTALPEGEARERAELGLQSLKGAGLMAIKGFSSEEVAWTFARARELARELNDTYQEFTALQGLWGFHYTRGDAAAAARVAAELMARASASSQPALLQYAHYALGASLQQAGKLAEARGHLEQALAFGGAQSPQTGRIILGPDPAVLCLTTLSDVLFGLGYPDQSLRRSYEALKAVTRDSDPFSFAMAMLFAVQVHCGRGEGKKAEEMCREMIDLCDRNGFPYWLATAHRVACWAVQAQGRWEDAIAMMNRQFEESAGTDEEEPSQYNLLPFLADAYRRVGNLDLGFAALERWHRVRGRYPLAALDKAYHRIRGELLLKARSTAEAEASLRHAIALSLAEGAKTEQLRATTVLAALLRDTGRHDEARAMLAEIYNWFTEGFDTADLRIAKALLDELKP